MNTNIRIIRIIDIRMRTLIVLVVSKCACCLWHCKTKSPLLMATKIHFLSFFFLGYCSPRVLGFQNLHGILTRQKKGKTIGEASPPPLLRGRYTKYLFHSQNNSTYEQMPEICCDYSITSRNIFPDSLRCIHRKCPPSTHTHTHTMDFPRLGDQCLKRVCSRAHCHFKLCYWLEGWFVVCFI